MTGDIRGATGTGRSTTPETRVAWCPTCERGVEVALTTSPVHGGQANLDDNPHTVCLDFGAPCTSTTCPVFGLPPVVMGVRLARSEHGEGRMRTQPALCEGCGDVVDMRIVDDAHGVCPVCQASNRIVLLELNDESVVAIARAK